MGQVLWITHQDTDYSFEILNKEPLSRETTKIVVLVNGTTLTLVKSDRYWVPEQVSEEERERGLAIGKAIALRYRI